MNRKNVLLTLALAALLVLAGCEDSSTASGDDLSDDTGEDLEGVNVGESFMFEMRLTEKNQMNLVRKRPPFTMDDSLERQNLIRRYQYLNDQNNVHHVYLMSNDGKVVSYYTAQGKVSSVNSKLTNDKQIVARQRCLRTTHDGGDGACFETVESPQMDGSYGTNGDAIFFFTTDGHYVEWNGIYVVSEEPKQIQTAVTLVEMDDENNDVSGDEGNESEG